MTAIIDLTGRRFGMWLVKGRSAKKGSLPYWSCVCDCGTERPVFGENLKRGLSVSCGCLKPAQTALWRRTHGGSHLPCYQSWKAMRNRCLKPKHVDYPNYGGRGIAICDRWLKFDGFREDMEPTWRKGLSIERRETDGNYEPSNCFWATPKQQANNRRNNVIAETPDGPMSVSQAAERFGMPRDVIAYRVRKGVTGHDLLAPVRYRSRSK